MGADEVKIVGANEVYLSQSVALQTSFEVVAAVQFAPGVLAELVCEAHHALKTLSQGAGSEQGSAECS